MDIFDEERLLLDLDLEDLDLERLDLDLRDLDLEYDFRDRLTDLDFLEKLLDLDFEYDLLLDFRLDLPLERERLLDRDVLYLRLLGDLYRLE